MPWRPPYPEKKSASACVSMHVLVFNQEVTHHFELQCLLKNCQKSKTMLHKLDRFKCVTWAGIAV